LAPFDLPPLTAAKLAVADINKQGGVLGRPLKLVVSDMHSVPSDGPRAALAVLGAGAQMVIVSCDYDIGSPAATTAQAQGKIAFSTCAGSFQFGPKGLGPLAYTMGSAAQTEGVVESPFAVKVKGCKTGYLLTDTDLQYFKNVALGWQQGFPAAGGKIVGSQTFTQAGLNAPAVVDKFLAVSPRPQCALLAFNAFDGGAVVRQLRASGFTGPIFGSNSWDGDYWKKLSPHLSNFYFTNYGSIYGDDPNAAVNQLVTRWRAANGGTLPENSNLLTGYAVIQAWAKAANMAGSLDTTKIAAELDKFTNVPLIVGPTTFSAPGLHISLQRPMEIMGIKNGKTSYLKTATPQIAVVAHS
jgi:branched-chain amino acid transport system substrate-binding protein